ncbi:tetratricopeptide repeat protein [Anaeromyxobacter sp. SG26]|uniref:tetratricopeptide repeat protein n=1 Tax=Anaeromyxobacter sp. SG26 TaxID=2925407 RepID=UPI001F5A705A|nr:tetratricopeptide repeat protein [Anaeromyxobacter sp. SG26]
MNRSRSLAVSSAVMLSAVLLFACATTRRASQEGVSGVRLAVARDLVDRRQYGDALAAIQAIHESEGRSAATLTLRARAYRGQGNTGDAEDDLREALRMDRDYAPAHAALAIMDDEAKRWADGEGHHRRAAELAPQNAAYLSDWGWALYRQGRTQDALARLQQAVRLDPMPARYHNNLGFAYARAGDFTRAAQQFASGGSPAEAKNNLGYAYELAGNLPQAFAAYSDAVRLAPGFARARANLEEVAKKLDRAVPSEPARPEKVPSGRMQ